MSGPQLFLSYRSSMLQQRFCFRVSGALYEVNPYPIEQMCCVRIHLYSLLDESDARESMRQQTFTLWPCPIFSRGERLSNCPHYSPRPQYVVLLTHSIF